MMVRFKDITKKLVAVVAACLMVFYGMASYMTADAFYEDQGYWIYNYETKEVIKYALRVDLPIYNGNGGGERAGLIDDRVPDTEVSVVRLVGGGTTASGFIIDNHIIATAAHCVYSDSDKCFKANMRVEIYDEGCTSPLKTIYPKEAHIPVKYPPYLNKQYDYALLYVEEDLSEYGMFSLGVAMDDFMTSGATVTVSGFPGYISSLPEADSKHRYKADGQILYMNGSNSEEQNRQIKYNAYTSGGDSGGPVYTTQTFNGKTYHTVIGIHTTKTTYADGSIAEHRFGTRITSTLLIFYYNNEYIGSTVL